MPNETKTTNPNAARDAARALGMTPETEASIEAFAAEWAAAELVAAKAAARFERSGTLSTARVAASAARKVARLAKKF